MKILLIDDFAEPGGGIAIYFDRIKDDLEKLGHKVYSFRVCRSTSTSGDQTFYKVTSNPLLRLVQGVIINPILALKLKKFINKIQPDVIHLHNVDRFSTSILLPLLNTKAQVIRGIHDYGFACPTVWCVKQDNLKICEGNVKLRCIKHCISWYKYPIYKYIFWVKHFLYQKIIHEYVAGSKNLIKYMTDFNLTPIHYIPYYVQNLPKHKREGKNRILCVSNLNPQKGVQFLIEAMPYVLKEIPNAKLTILPGGIEKGEYLQKIVKKLKLQNSIRFIWNLPHKDVLKQYFKHNVTVVPSIWMEQFCLVGLESTLAGTPVVGSKIGGIPDWLSENNNGLFAKRADSKDIAKKIIKILISEKLQKKARDYANKNKNKFSKKQHIELLLKSYESK